MATAHSKKFHPASAQSGPEIWEESSPLGREPRDGPFCGNAITGSRTMVEGMGAGECSPCPQFWIPRAIQSAGWYLDYRDSWQKMYKVGLKEG